MRRPCGKVDRRPAGGPGPRIRCPRLARPKTATCSRSSPTVPQKRVTPRSTARPSTSRARADERRLDPPGSTAQAGEAQRGLAVARHGDLVGLPEVDPAVPEREGVETSRRAPRRRERQQANDSPAAPAVGRRRATRGRRRGRGRRAVRGRAQRTGGAAARAARLPAHAAPIAPSRAARTCRRAIIPVRCGCARSGGSSSPRGPGARCPAAAGSSGR